MGFLETVDKIAGSHSKRLAIHGLLSDYPTKTATILEKILVKSLLWRKSRPKRSFLIPLIIWLISTKGRDKNAQIYQLTQLMQPYLAMIFVNTKTRADELHSYLTAQGLKVAKIHGGYCPS